MFTPIDINDILGNRLAEIRAKIENLDPNMEGELEPFEELHYRYDEVVYLRDIVFPRSLI